MEYVLTNSASAQVRRVDVNGRAYLVAPLTMIVPGVLAGSKGPLYYSPEEVSRSADSWNGMPIVVYHPTDGTRNVSARDPGVLERQEVGRVYRSRYVGGKLVAEGWFDEEATRRVDGRVYDALRTRQKMELSTGLFTDNSPAPANANYNGRGYAYVARNYRPDHLAILPDQVGACSLADGCGLMVNARHPATAGLSGGWAELTDNWCNQYGGTTCKGGKGATKGKARKPKLTPKQKAAVKREAEKIKAAPKEKQPGLIRRALSRLAEEIGGSMASVGTTLMGAVSPSLNVAFDRDGNWAEVTANWCNQHGGTTCKGGAKGTGKGEKGKGDSSDPVEAAGDKLTKIQEQLREYGGTPADPTKGLKSGKWGHTAREKIKALADEHEKALEEFKQAKKNTEGGGKGKKDESPPAPKKGPLFRRRGAYRGRTANAAEWQPLTTNSCHCGGTCGGCGTKAGAHGNKGVFDFTEVDNARPSAGLAITPEKACKIMRDGKVHGKPLTKRQKGMFGAKCGQRADNAYQLVPGDWVEVNAFCPTGKGGGVDPTCTRKVKAAGKVKISSEGSASALVKQTDEWVAAVKSSSSSAKWPTRDTMDPTIDKLLEGADIHEVAKAMGLVQRFPSRKKAVARIKQAVHDRVGMVARAYQ